jgi:elongation factor P
MSADQLGDAVNFLTENLKVNMLFFKDRPIGITLPNFVNLRVIHAEPGVKGDTASGATKPVVLETGYEIQVPLFVEEGDVLKIDTRTGTYVERV